MRWFIITSLLLAALALSEPRQKRDLNYLTNLFRSTLFGSRAIAPTPASNTEPEYNLFRVPSLGNKLFKVATKENHSVRAGYPTVASNKQYDAPPKQTILETLPKTVDTSERVYVFPKESNTYDTEYRIKFPFEPKYSYKQLQNNEPVMIYTAHNNPDVIVNEEIRVTTLPKCIKQRIDEVVLIGANPFGVDPVRTMFLPNPSHNIKYTAEKGQHKNHLNRPLYYTLPLKNNLSLRPKAPEKMLTLPIPLRSEVPTSQVHRVINMDEVIGGDKTIGLIPPPYISHVLHSTTEKIEEKKYSSGKTTEVNLLNTPVINQSLSSYVYKQLIHDSPNPTADVNVGDQFDKNNLNISDLPSLNNYVFIPPKVDDPNSAGVITVSGPDDYVKHPAIDKNEGPVVKFNEIGSLLKDPIVVSEDKTFSYHQNNMDGSSLSINGNNKGVSVDVINSTAADNRGDIPDSSM